MNTVKKLGFSIVLVAAMVAAMEGTLRIAATSNWFLDRVLTQEDDLF